MNQQQVKYARSRLQNILQQKRDALKAKFLVPRQRLTHTKKFKLIKGGEVKMRAAPLRSTGYDDINTFFDFSKYEWDSHCKKGYEKSRQKLEVVYNDLVDNLLLGDADEAIHSINTLSSFEV